MANNRIFVGNLPMDIKESEVDDLFYKYGPITNIEIKRKDRPPAFCFITYEDPRDAEDAIYGRDGYRFDNARLRVEMTNSTGRDRRGGDRFGDRRGGPDRRSDTPYPSRNIGGESGPKRSEFRVLVSGLPRSASWQDLKDFGRQVGDVVHGDVDRNGNGVLEYRDVIGMEDAVRKLDDTKFENRMDTAYVRVRFAPDGAGGSGSSRRSPSPSPRRRSISPRRRSPSVDSRDGRYGGDRRRSPSRSPSRSPRSDRSRSPSPRSRSPSRSRSRSRSHTPPRSRSASPSPRGSAAEEA